MTNKQKVMKECKEALWDFMALDEIQPPEAWERHFMKLFRKCYEAGRNQGHKEMLKQVGEFDW